MVIAMEIGMMINRTKMPQNYLFDEALPQMKELLDDKLQLNYDQVKFACRYAKGTQCALE